MAGNSSIIGKIKDMTGQFLVWRARNIPDNYFVIILSVLIGFLAGIAAYVLKTSVYRIEELLTADFHMQTQNYRYVLYPAIGILLTVLFLRYLIRDEHNRHGIPRILYVISRLDGKMKFHKTFSSIIGGSLTAGFGGSIGLESPIISTGSSVGSNLAQALRLNYRHTTLLIGCGAAGAMASIFTTPIAAVIFSLEVLMLDLTTASIIPLLMASVTGAITTKFLLAENILIHFKVTQPFEINDVPFYIVLGILAGLVSWYFASMHFFVRRRLSRFKNRYVKVAIGGIMLGLLIFLFPSLYGEGYDNIKLIMAGDATAILNNSFFYSYRNETWIFLIIVLVIMLFKIVATTLTTEAGGIGGIFAPAAVMGGLTGFVFSRFINDLKIFGTVHESNFTLTGMAAVLGGVLHAPLTAIFLIAEMTNGYELIVPLMLSTAISFITIKVFAPHSIFTKDLAERGDLITHHKDKTVLTLMNIKDVIDTDIKTIHPGATLGELTKVISKSNRNMFPVIDEKRRFLGVIDLNDVREDMFIKEKYDVSIKNYMFQPMEHVSSTDSMKSVMDKFKKTGYYNLPVIDDGVYRGWVSRAHIFDAYRRILLEVSEE
jgi:CIC family chloride channel protein